MFYPFISVPQIHDFLSSLMYNHFVIWEPFISVECKDNAYIIGHRDIETSVISIFYIVNRRLIYGIFIPLDLARRFISSTSRIIINDVVGKFHEKSSSRFWYHP